MKNRPLPCGAIFYLYSQLHLMLCDSHVHIGRAESGFDVPLEFIAKSMFACNIDRFLYFSVAYQTESAQYFSKWCEDEERMSLASNGAGVPCLWMTYEMFTTPEKFVSGNWKALKFHAGCEDRTLKDTALELLFEVAENYRKPLILHTGEDYYCSCSRYKNMIKNHKNAVVILAHGRPLSGALECLAESENVFVDTAYMPLEAAKTVADAGFADRLVFGSDFPVDRYFFPNEDVVARYNKNKCEYLSAFGEKIFNDNFCRLFL